MSGMRIKIMVSRDSDTMKKVEFGPSVKSAPDKHTIGERAASRKAEKDDDSYQDKDENSLGTAKVTRP